MVEKIKEVINDYQNGWIGAEHIVDKYHEMLMDVHANTWDICNAKDKALTPLANFICYLFSEENTSNESMESYSTEYTQMRFDGRFELNCRITQLELEVKKLKEENEKLLNALQETSVVLADEAIAEEESSLA